MPENLSDRQHVKKVRHISPVHLVLICAAIVIAWLMFYFPDYARLNDLRQANKRLRSEIAAVEKEITDLKGKMKRVGSDPLIYEKVARDELGAVKEDEIVVDIAE